MLEEYLQEFVKVSMIHKQIFNSCQSNDHLKV